MIKSPLRYPGGKSRAVALISSLVPDYDEYREPFLGGGSIFVYLKQIFQNKKYHINDIYLELYKFWYVAQNNMQQLIRQIYLWKNEFANGKDLHRFLSENKNNFDDIELASAFFIFNRITFSGTTESGGYSEQAFKGRFTESSINRLLSLSNILSNTIITNDDYESVVRADGENVFIFLDPPYYSATKSALYGKNGGLHKSFDHERFASVMKDCKHKYLITYDDSDYIKNMFSFANIIPYNLVYGMRNVNSAKINQKGKEIIITNYLSDSSLSFSNAQPRLFA